MLSMRLTRLCLGTILPLSLSLAATNTEHDKIQRDVCIIGGGSAGTYAAVRLKQMGKTVALIEKEDLLGGQVNTYDDPVSGKTIDYGVKVFNNVSVVTDYFASLGVGLTEFTGYVPDETTIYADLATSSDIPASAILPAGNLTDGLLRYQYQLNKYPYLGNGFDLPEPVPDDLLLPWGDFIDKYNLSSIAGLVYGLVGGPGNILAQPTLYVAKNFDQIQVDSALSGGALTTANENNQELYDKALAFLGEDTDALVSSDVIQVTRDTNGVKVNVMTPSGSKWIEASKLLIAIPPLPSMLSPFLDLSEQERNTFSQFNNSYLWASIVSGSGIPKKSSLANIDPSVALGIPPEPAIFLTEPTEVEDYHIVLYGSPNYKSDNDVQDEILLTLNRWKRASNQSTGALEESAKVIAFKSHSPYFFTLSVDAIRSGFYQRANELQGERNTFYTGAAWETNDSTSIWNFTETQILPKIMASLSMAGGR